ncbi:MAG TPA: hypothetical protein VF719_11840 [Abditibacteriaceae bacterium]|jgi:hypothetical protein
MRGVLSIGAKTAEWRARIAASNQRRVSMHLTELFSGGYSDEGFCVDFLIEDAETKELTDKEVNPEVSASTDPEED